ncbi:nitrate reductase [Vannielia litorea]|uniref:Assimilatory nitrate reductase (NADH) alpha subunit apoprotein n=1 Tax=Vannielia litorea TaxID=1217970 RepID=A0A1N6GF67_9RHOB|nr:nitrate reductase [Vannielia litorea]SIO06175.1 assimilatory nitrate reductase (NADH) alpha subunit apoprotein [Vannielia litorea]
MSAPAVCTTCPYCGVGCGVLATPDGAGGLTVSGDKSHPANFGRLCSKGSALGETVGPEGRLLAPRLYGKAAGWPEATAEVARRFSETIAQHGPDSVAFYVSGQLLTEDYYVANKLMKGFIGSANIDTNSRLCMASSVAGHRRAFGTDTVPGTYEDLEQADLVVLTGSNLAWCHPVLYQRIVAAKAARPSMQIVVIDPRRTATCDAADLHLPLAPGSDVALFNGLLRHLDQSGAVSEAFLRASVEGFDEALAAAISAAPATAETGLPDALLHRFYALWAGTEKVVTVYSQGVNQSAQGTDKVNAILNCHLATGRIGRPGMGPFSVTGQPNAMGGREVGGLANMLACHLDLENAAHRMAVREFWQAPRMPEAQGLKAVDMFDAVERGQIKALWIMATNPAVSMPEADRVRAAIAGCEFVVVSDITAETDTARLAHVLLPATGWGEKEGTVTNSERRISRQRTVLPAPGQARHDWQIIAQVAAAMGWGSAFDYSSPAEIFREYATLSGIAAQLGKDFDISGLAGLTDADYADLAPVQWPVNTTRTGGRFFADGRFFTPSGRARMLPLRSAPTAANPAFPFRLNTGRVRDHWHTMTRTGQSPRLSQHMAEPYLEVHPDDASRLGLRPAGIAEVTSPSGRALCRTMVTDRVRPGEVFMPMHWTGETAALGRADALVASVVDPVSGQPESKGAKVAIAPFAAAWFGFAVSASKPRPDAPYWALARARGGWRLELAGGEAPEDWEAWARRVFGLGPEAQALVVEDRSRNGARLAFLAEGRLAAALFIAAEPVAVSRSFMAGQLGAAAAPAQLSGQPGQDMPDPGATLCACFDVGVNTILAAIQSQHLASVEAIGAALQAGTNCGSCRPELAALLTSATRREAAE